MMPSACSTRSIVTLVPILVVVLAACGGRASSEPARSPDGAATASGNCRTDGDCVVRQGCCGNYAAPRSVPAEVLRCEGEPCPAVVEQPVVAAICRMSTCVAVHASTMITYPPGQ